MGEYVESFANITLFAGPPTIPSSAPGNRADGHGVCEGRTSQRSRSFGRIEDGRSPLDGQRIAGGWNAVRTRRLDNPTSAPVIDPSDHP